MGCTLTATRPPSWQHHLRRHLQHDNNSRDPWWRSPAVRSSARQHHTFSAYRQQKIQIEHTNPDLQRVPTIPPEARTSPTVARQRTMTLKTTAHREVVTHTQTRPGHTYIHTQQVQTEVTRRFPLPTGRTPTSSAPPMNHPAHNSVDIDTSPAGWGIEQQQQHGWPVCVLHVHRIHKTLREQA